MTLTNNRNDPSTWRAAMASHGDFRTLGNPGWLRTKRPHRNRYDTLTGIKGLQPLGNYTAIKQWVEKLISNAERLNGGTLPQVYQGPPIPDSPTRLLLPANGVGAGTLAALEEASTRGLQAVSDVSYILGSASEQIQIRRGREDRIREELLASDTFAGYDPDDPDDARALNEAVRESVEAEEDAFNDKEGPSEEQARNELRNFYREDHPDATDAETERWVNERIEANERQGKGQDRGTMAAQRAGAIATVCAGVVDATVDAIDTEADSGIDVAVVVLDVIGALCTSIGGAVGGIAGGVLVIIGILCELISLILSAIEEYFVEPEDGIDPEWQMVDKTFILHDRLRILCQCEEEALANWQTVWAREVADRRTPEEERQLMDSFLLQTTKNRYTPEQLRQNALNICMFLGGSGESYRMCTDIQSWLIYIGVPEEEADMVFDWLYESRKYTTVTDRQTTVWNSRGNYGVHFRGYDEGWLDGQYAFCATATCRRKHPDLKDPAGKYYQCPCDDDDYGPADSDADSTNCGSSEPNLWKGSPEWYRVCQGIHYGAIWPERFTLDHLRTLYDYVAKRLDVVFIDIPKETRESARAIGRGIVAGGTPWDNIMSMPNSRAISTQWFNCFVAPGLVARDLCPNSGRLDCGNTEYFFPVRIGSQNFGVWCTDRAIPKYGVPTVPSALAELKQWYDSEVRARGLNILHNDDPGVIALTDEYRLRKRELFASVDFRNALTAQIRSDYGLGGLSLSGGLGVVLGLGALAGVGALLLKKR